MSIVMLLPKFDGMPIVMGELATQNQELPEGALVVGITLKNIVCITLVPGPNGMGPMPHNYPTVFSKHFVNRELLNNWVQRFEEKDYVFIEDENNIQPQILELYRKEMADRAGIILTGEMPKGVPGRLING